MISFIAFSLGRAWQGFWRNAVMSIAATATMVLMLLLLSGFWILQTGLLAGLQFVEQKVQVVADVYDEASSNQVTDLLAQVKQMPEVKSVDFVSRAEALQRFQKSRAAQGEEDLTKYLDSNPLHASIEVTLKDPHNFGQVEDHLRAAPIVQRVIDIQDLVDRVLTVTNFLRQAGAIILGIIGLIVLFIIVNTIRLAVLARAAEIEIMRLVGASDAFIRWPFVFEGALVGLLGAAISLALLLAIGEPLSRFMFDFFRVLPIQVGSLTRDLALIVLGAGVGLGVLGSWLSVRTYLIR